VRLFDIEHVTKTKECYFHYIDSLLEAKSI